MGRLSNQERFERYLDKIEAKKIESLDNLNPGLYALTNPNAYDNFFGVKFLGINNFDISDREKLPFIEKKISFDKRADFSLNAFTKKITGIRIWDYSSELSYYRDLNKSYISEDKNYARNKISVFRVENFGWRDIVYSINNKEFIDNFDKLFNGLKDGCSKGLEFEGFFKKRSAKKYLKERDVEFDLTF